MVISLKSNRTFMIKALMPCVVLAFVTLAAFGIVLIFNYDEQSDAIPVMTSLACLMIVIIIIMLVLKFYRGKRYDFSEEQIVCYKRQSIVDTINISDIRVMMFYQWRFRYIITILLGALNEGGCWKLHVIMNDGTKKELAFFSKKDAELLKEKLYQNLLSIN